MNSTWNVRSCQLVVIVILGAVSVVAACGSAASTFNSKADLTGTSPIDSLLTVTSIKIDNFGFGMFYRGFRASLTSALAACGVKSRMLQVDPLGLGPELNDRIEQDIKEFHPSAVLDIKVISRNTTVSDTGSVREEWIFELNMLDVVSKKRIWMAKTMPKFNARYIAPGMSFATSIASRLRDDGVLRSCPTDAVGWPAVPRLPDCKDERRSLVTQAQQTTDMAERKRLISTMPTCD